MRVGVKIAIGVTVLVLLAIGGEFAYLHHRDAVDKTVAPVPADTYKMSKDDEVMMSLKHEHPMLLKDEKDLKGRNLWMSAGGQMDYYPYAGHVDYAHSAGLLLGAQKILVKDPVEQVAPKSATFRIPGGEKQVLLVFTLPDDANSTKEYAVPVGNKDQGSYTLLTDEMFFYDDPHTLFSYWGPEVWKAIDEHRAIVGMSEAQVQMALGQVSNPHGDKTGDRMVEYDDQGKPKMVTFEGGKATKIEDEKK